MGGNFEQNIPDLWKKMKDLLRTVFRRGWWVVSPWSACCCFSYGASVAADEHCQNSSTKNAKHHLYVQSCKLENWINYINKSSTVSAPWEFWAKYSWRIYWEQFLEGMLSCCLVCQHQVKHPFLDFVPLGVGGDLVVAHEGAAGSEQEELSFLGSALFGVSQWVAHLEVQQSGSLTSPNQMWLTLFDMTSHPGKCSRTIKKTYYFFFLWKFLVKAAAFPQVFFDNGQGEGKHMKRFPDVEKTQAIVVWAQ